MNEPETTIAPASKWDKTFCRRGITPEMRFWKGIDKNGPIPAHAPHLGNCWVWKAASKSHPYGTFKLKGVNVKPHRMSWLIHFGSLTPGLEVCHKCDNTACVRDSHLFEASHRDNIKDMFSKNRANTAKGSRHGEAKLTEEKVSEIRQMLADKISYRIIAEKFGVVYGCIGHIKAGRSWKHV